MNGNFFAQILMKLKDIQRANLDTILLKLLLLWN